MSEQDNWDFVDYLLAGVFFGAVGESLRCTLTIVLTLLGDRP